MADTVNNDGDSNTNSDENSSQQMQQLLQLLGGGAASGPGSVPGYTSSSTTLQGTPVTNSANAIDVGGVTLQLNEAPTTKVILGTAPDGFANPQPIPNQQSVLRSLTGEAPQSAPGVLQPQTQYATIQSLMNSFDQSLNNTSFKLQFAQQAYDAGLISSPKASENELLVAFQAVVEQAASAGSSWETVLQQASEMGWANIQPDKETSDYGLSGTGNAGNAPDPSTSSTTTTYTSYMDPATAQGALADAYYRLLGRLPTQKEYESFLSNLYSYQADENAGDYDEKTTGKSGSSSDGGTDSTTVNNEIKQEGVGVRGAEFLASQQAMNNPSYGAYQAATTYFHAFMSALSGPGAGLEGSGPDVTAP